MPCRDVLIPFLKKIPDIDYNSQIWVAADTKYWSDTSLKKVTIPFKLEVLIIIYLNKKI